MKDTIVNYYDFCTGLNPVGARVQSNLPIIKTPITISMLPNPNYGEWIIDLTIVDAESQYIVEVIDALGRMVDKITIDATTSFT